MRTYGKMDNLISRQAAVDALQEEIDKVIPPFDDDTIGSIRCGVRLARNIIEYLPSAQPTVEDIINKLAKEISDRVIQALEENYEIIPKRSVIRCKDCKHFIRSEGVCKALSINNEFPVYVQDDNFCSNGERREGCQ